MYKIIDDKVYVDWKENEPNEPCKSNPEPVCVHVCAGMYVCVYVCVCMCVWGYVCVHVCVYVHVCACV